MATNPLPSRRFDRSLLEAGPLAGQVVAVFSRAAVARLEAGPLLTLLHPSRDLVPFGVAIPWDEAPPVAGATVTLSARELALGAARLRLEGEGTPLRLERAAFDREVLRSQLPAIRRIAGAERGDFERKALERAEESLHRVVVAVSTGLFAPADLAVAARRLIGAGFGSTPTGDDWLVGLAAAGYRLDGSGFTFGPAWSALLAALEAVPADATTPVAREMLRHAARAEFPEALLRFASLLGAPASPTPLFLEACRRLRAVGSQTGGDLMTGALALAEAVCSQHGGIA